MNSREFPGLRARHGLRGHFMSRLRRLSRWTPALAWPAAIAAGTLAGCVPQFEGPSGVKLYAMQCGTLEVSDIADLADDGRFDGELTRLVNPSFLIRHPDGDLLWDTGYSDSLADSPTGSTAGVWHSTLETKLVDQLAQLGLAPEDIEFLSLSHVHPDHSGNANLFADSKLIISEPQHEYIFSPAVLDNFGQSYSDLEQAETLLFNDQHDVFGDGSVIVYSMPGHTPGSSVLKIETQGSGTVLLTGDLYIHDRGRALQTVPTFTVDRAQLIESRKRFEALAEHHNARVVIQHSPKDFEALPAFPAFLD